MSFAERLLESGYRSRFRTATVPFTRTVRAMADDPEVESDRSSEDDGLTLRGLATPFDSPTRIDNWFEGTFDEMFRAGSFRRTLGIGGQVSLFEHGDHPLFGSIPIARITRLEESKRGLEYTARMFDNWLTEPLRDAIAGETINSMSIQFRPVSERVTERADDVPLVEILDAELREVGPVLFPAYGDTSLELRNKIVDSVRRGFDLALTKLDGIPGSGAQEPPNTSPGGSHLVVNRNRLATARLRLLEIS